MRGVLPAGAEDTGAAACLASSSRPSTQRLPSFHRRSHRRIDTWRAPQQDRVVAARATANGKGPAANDGDARLNGVQWQDVGAPSYLHSTRTTACDDFEKALGEAAAKVDGKTCEAAIWDKIRSEAQADAAEEPLLSSFLYASILSHDTFERSLAFVLANRLADVTMLATELFEIFHSVLKGNAAVREAAVADLVAVKERDPACLTHAAALLYFKGYHAIQVYRVAHTLWQRGQRVLALALQSRVSEVFAVDIHPAARIGKGLLLDHGTGVVIGETAVVGNNVSIMQNVTLGGTGKDTGDRHPKVADNVLISAGATVLGNITVGKGAQVAAGSLVLKPVPNNTMVAGSPASEVGKVTWNPALNMEHWISKRPRSPAAEDDAFCEEYDAAAAQAADSVAATAIAEATVVDAGAAPNVAAVLRRQKVAAAAGEQEFVEAVLSDEAAQRMWPEAAVAEGDEQPGSMEYMI